MKNRLLNITVLALCLVSFSSVPAYAWSIPGITRPYDPTAYYDPVAVSIPDSAPSVFALRDLAANKGNVYDYTRHLKSILFGGFFKNIFGMETNKEELQRINNKTWSENSVTSNSAAQLSILESLWNKHHNTNESWANQSVNTTTSKIFETIGIANNKSQAQIDFDDVFLISPTSETEYLDRKIDDIPEEDKYKWIFAAYQKIAEAGANGASAREAITAGVTYATNLAANAEGENQAIIASNMMKGLETESFNNLSATFNNLVLLRTINNMRENDQKQRSAIIERDSNYYVADPYDSHNETIVKEMTGETHKSIGMPDFH